MKLLAIDPGNIHSAYVLMDKAYKPLKFGKVENEKLARMFADEISCDQVVIEGVQSFGMPVGRTVFDTCIWIGRYKQIFFDRNIPVHDLYRQDVKLNLCRSNKAGDSNIRRALIDRFAQHDLKNGKGRKADPDWFYGFAADTWSAFALGCTYLDLKKADELEGEKQ